MPFFSINQYKVADNCPLIKKLIYVTAANFFIIIPAQNHTQQKYNLNFYQQNL